MSKKNRYILSKIIDCIKFCGEFELSLRGHDESDTSINPGIFKGLVNFTATLDNIFKEHLRSTTVFKGTSKDIQNDLLDCMLEVCRDHIKKGILECEFISIIADETTDVAAQFQLSLIVRYLLKSGKPTERFWTFLNPLGHDAVSLSTAIKSLLIELIGDKKSKLISLVS